MFENKLNVVLEAYLNDHSKGQLDFVVAQLQEIKDADYSMLPGGTYPRNAGEFYINQLTGTIRTMRQYAKTEADLENDRVQGIANQERSDAATAAQQKIVSLCERVVNRFPRFSRCLTNEFQYVQPNGELRSIPYQHVEVGILASLVKFFRIPGLYDGLANKVSELRDFGFNISSKLLNTDGGKFRTRYAYITDVTLRYSGPMFKVSREATNKKSWHSIPEVINVEKRGEATIKIAYTDRYGTSLLTRGVENVTLDHIGEIIDTIDILLRASYGIANLSDIQLMGTELVQYVLQLDTKRHTDNLFKDEGDRNPNFSIDSSEITNVKETTQLIFNHLQQRYGYNQEPEEPMTEHAPPKEAPPRRETDKPLREKPTRREPFNPPRPKRMPKPKALKETFERSVHPGTEKFWSGIRQSEHPYAKHPLMAMYGREKAVKSWEKGIQSLKRVFPELQDMPNPQIMQRVPELAMNAMKQVMMAERPYREELKQIAKDIVHKVWGVPVEMMNADFQDRVGMDATEHTEADPQEIERLRHHINKRITMGALTQGAAVHNMAAIHHMANEQLERLAPELLNLYDQFASSSTSMYWILDFASMANLAGHAIGQVKVEFDDETDTPVIHAQAMVFPVLVQELVKGVMEVLSMHGTDETLSGSELDTIQSQAERTEDEPWLIQVGPHLWDAFLQIVPKNHPIADVVANFAAKDPEFIHNLLADTIEAVHSSSDPTEQREVLVAMMDELDAQDEPEFDPSDEYEPEESEEWDIGEPW